MSSNGNNKASSKESDPLLSPSKTAGKYYFLNKQDSSFKGTSVAVNNNNDDGGNDANTIVIEGPPTGTTEDEFAPRMIGHKVNKL